MDLDIGSKETEILLKLLNEFLDRPKDLRSLVQALREKGYCKSLSTAYRYANRVLAIREIFNDRSVKSLDKNQVTLRGNDPIIVDSGNGWKWHGRGAPLLAEINEYMDNKSYTVDAKRQFIEQKLQELYHVLNICLNYEAEDPSMKNY